MRSLLLAAAAAAVMPFAADAAVTVTSTAYGLDAPAGDGVVIDFEGSSYGLFTLTGSGFAVQSGNNVDGAAPADGPINAMDDPTRYLSVYSGAAKLFGPQGFTDVSLYWGSMDDYNALDLLDEAGQVFETITTATLGAGDDGDQLAPMTNRRVTINSTDPIYGLTFRSTASAFETDNIKFSGAVPEPATWGLMVLGFGAIGAATRRRRAVMLTA